MNTPKSFEEYLALSNADKMRLLGRQPTESDLIEEKDARIRELETAIVEWAHRPSTGHKLALFQIAEEIKAREAGK